MGKSPSKVRKTVILLIFVVGVGALSYVSTNYPPSERRFMTDLQKDLKRLHDAKILPPGFEKIRKVQLFATSEKLEKMFRKYPIQFDAHSDGDFELEVFV